MTRTQKRLVEITVALLGLPALSIPILATVASPAHAEVKPRPKPTTPPPGPYLTFDLPDVLVSSPPPPSPPPRPV